MFNDRVNRDCRIRYGVEDWDIEPFAGVPGGDVLRSPATSSNGGHQPATVILADFGARLA